MKVFKYPASCVIVGLHALDDTKLKVTCPYTGVIKGIYSGKLYGEGSGAELIVRKGEPLLFQNTKEAKL